MTATIRLQDARIRYAFRLGDGWPAAVRNDATPRVQGLPVELRTQGLVGTVATLMGGPHAHLADALALWVLEKAPRLPLRPWAGTQGGVSRRLLAACRDADRGAFLAAQAQALALAEHIKRFASALS